MGNFICIYRLICLLVGLSACSQANKDLGQIDDNFLEEVVEEGIKIQSGKNIDLTPNSPEKKVPTKRKKYKPKDHNIDGSGLVPFMNPIHTLYKKSTEYLV
jgi:hypothetical protein